MSASWLCAWQPFGPEAVERIIKTIAVFDDFCHANDPYEEHDFGSFEVDGHRIFFKIDYLDQAVTCLCVPRTSSALIS